MTDEAVYFGIDLGTTNSVIAYIDKVGAPTVVPNQDADGAITPSVVYFEADGDPVVGEVAKDVGPLYPDRTVSLVKREMGQQREWVVDDVAYTPETLSALILKRLASNAEAHCGTPVQQVVITVPAYFGMLERGATRTAGRIAGLDVIGIVPEPVAAALHYDVGADADGRTILVYDLGGGTFDTTVIAIEAGSIEVLCTDGDSQLGGADWDRRLSELILAEFRIHAELGDEDPEDDEHFMRGLLTTAEEVKKDLSQAQARPVAPRLGRVGARFEITRQQFEAATTDLLETTLECTRRALATLATRHPGRRIDDILLVGGSTRMPAVARCLETEFGLKPRLHDPDLAVAKGAARYALGQSAWTWDGDESTTDDERLDTRAREIAAATGIPPEAVRKLAEKRVITVLPKGFGVRLLDTDVQGWEEDPESAAYVEHLVHANDPLPSGPHRRTYGTVCANQPEVAIALYEQSGAVEKRDLEYNTAIDHGEGLIAGIPPGPRGTPIEVTMTVDDEGLLTLTAVEPRTGTSLVIEVRINVMNDEQVETARRHVQAMTVKG